MSKLKLKKLVKTLGGMKGRHTELVSVYIPADFNIHETILQLKQEQGAAENIKSKSVRKNVTTALEKIIRHLQLYHKTPEHGLAVFCGNISEKEGAADIELWAIEPPDKLKTKLYWCDQRFDLTPLQDMLAEKEIYGLISMDKSEADIAILSGKKINPIVHFDSIVPGKTRAGGQSSQRFSRIREGLLNDWYKKVGEAINKIFTEHKEVLGILVGGSGPIKEELVKGDYIYGSIKQKILGIVDTSYSGEYGLHETIERGQDLLKEASVTKEKNLLQRFFNELQKSNSLVTYGINETLKAIREGAVDTVLVSEDSLILEIEYECQCGMKKKFVPEDKKDKQICETCNKIMKILGEKDVVEALEEEAKNYGSRIEVVSSETREGKQFQALGGVGAILRYQI